jgi:hypothetical protein
MNFQGLIRLEVETTFSAAKVFIASVTLFGGRGLIG